MTCKYNGIFVRNSIKFVVLVENKASVQMTAKHKFHADSFKFFFPFGIYIALYIEYISLFICCHSVTYMRNGKIYFSVIKRNRTQKFCFATPIQRKHVDSAVFIVFVNLVLSAIENDTRYISYRKLKISISVVGNIKVSESFRGSSACIMISARKYYGLLPFRKISQKIYNFIIIFVGLNFSYIAVYYIEVCLIIIVCGAFERLLKTFVDIGEKISI